MTADGLSGNLVLDNLYGPKRQTQGNLGAPEPYKVQGGVPEVVHRQSCASLGFKERQTTEDQKL